MLRFESEDLALTRGEIEDLFRSDAGDGLTDAELDQVCRVSEGWPIAVQLIWQSLRGGDGGHRRPAELFEGGPAGAGPLFRFLLQETFERQDPDLATFLLHTSVLRVVTPAACEAVVGDADVEHNLQRLREQGLFVVELGDGSYRYHHLFREFLQERLLKVPKLFQACHVAAADYFDAAGQAEEAIYHSLKAGDYRRAAERISAVAPAVLTAGRLGILQEWLGLLPNDAFASDPAILLVRGALSRLTGRYEQALDDLSAAEALWREQESDEGVARALRGQAMVYLDTVRPAQAADLLEQVLALTDKAAANRPGLLVQLAENKLNLGFPEEAEALHREAEALGGETDATEILQARILLRMGRVGECSALLEKRLRREEEEQSRGERRPPHSHRETVLMLSLLRSVQGDAGAARSLAEQGVELGQRLGSPLVTTVAYARLGHAWQLIADRHVLEDRVPPNFDAAACHESEQCYELAVRFGDELVVRRMRVEAMIGRIRALGVVGDIDAARRCAQEGVETARWAGDRWVEAVVDLSLGGALVFNGDGAGARECLAAAEQGFEHCGDRLGHVLALLWHALAEWPEPARRAETLELFGQTLVRCEQQGLDFLFLRPTLFGPSDPRCFVPLLLALEETGKQAAYVRYLLGELGLGRIRHHPGYRLRVQLLGGFCVWRGRVEVTAREWRRVLARELFELLASHPGRWFQREEIMEHLRPDSNPDAAARDFKAALNSLNRALEPDRPPERPFSYIERDGASYRLRLDGDIWIDAQAFEAAAREALQLSADGPADAVLEAYRRAWSLYGGDYLSDATAHDWAALPRDRLSELFLLVGEGLALSLLDAGQAVEALQICRRVVAQDPCREEAYRLMMRIHAEQGETSLALRAYEQCRQALTRELDAPPSPKTTALRDQILENANAGAGAPARR